jgi:hypothetical protein
MPYHTHMLTYVCQRPNPTVYEGDVMMKAQVNKSQFLRVKVTVNQSKVSLQSQPLHLIESCMLTQCSLHLRWLELHAVIRLSPVR